jgi:hypothetical protein
MTPEPTDVITAAHRAAHQQIAIGQLQHAATALRRAAGALSDADGPTSGHAAAADELLCRVGALRHSVRATAHTATWTPR